MGASEARSQLSSAVREIWSSPDMTGLRDQLSASAFSSGYASCVKSAMDSGRGGRESFRRCAETDNLSQAYRGAWGKPAGTPMIRPRY